MSTDTAKTAAPAGLRDAGARHAVENRLGTTMFVEAGAGSGKTTALVARIVRLICSGRCELGGLAAVTFTEAAAAELRVRVRERLADVAGGAEGEPDPAAKAQPDAEDERRRARRALDHIDEAAISTIHGFCQRLLAEHPIESGLPPRFEVLDEVQQSLEWRKQWSDALDAFGDNAGYRGLFQVASLLSVTRIEELVRDVAEEWDHCGTEPPDGLAVVAAVEAIVTRAAAMVVEALDVALALAAQCLDPTDRLALRLGDLRAHRDLLARTTRWEDQLAALVAEDRFGGQIGNKAAWLCDVNDVRAALSEAGDARNKAVQDCCDVVLPALVAMADVFARSLAAKRRAGGRLTFHDLLVLARDLLAGRPSVLESVRHRLIYLLVDEFQDTDPLQLEIAELIAFGGRRRLDAITVLGQEVGLAPAGSVDANGVAGGPGGADTAGSADTAGGADTAGSADTAGGADTGRLFLVGDPQQSIYRFRGADLDAYIAARERHAGGAATTLTSNFRSVPGILEFVNECFSSILGGFSRLDAVRADAGSGPPVRVLGKPFANPKLRRHAQREIESEACAQAIERAVRTEKWMVEDQSHVHEPTPPALRPARFSDVAILVPRRTGLDQIEAALDARGIGYRVESASLIFRSQEVRNLLALCRAIDAPGDQLALVAALRSPAFACGDDDLRAYRALGGRWSIEFPPPPPRTSPAASESPESPRVPASPESAQSPGSPAEHSGGGGDPAVVVEALGRLASYAARRGELGPIGVLELAVRDRRLLQLAVATPRVRESWRRVRFLLEQARAFVDAGGGGLTEFADWVDEQLSEGLRAVESVLPEPDEDVVHVLTVHGAKGLEFPIAVLVGFGTTDAVTGPIGPRVLRGAGKVEVRFRKGRLETSGYERLYSEKKLREREEANRVLYVAATRARDHLVFCAHHLRQSGESRSLGQVLYESALAASEERPSLCEFVDLGAPSGPGSLVQGALFSLDAVVPDRETPDGSPAAGSRSTTTGLLADETADAGRARTARHGSAAPSTVEASRQAYLSWQQARDELLVRIRRPAGVRATELAALAGIELGISPAEEAESDEELESDGEVASGSVSGGHRSRGRPGTRIGRAVHATLQSIGLEAARAVAVAPTAESAELWAIACSQARAEHVTEHADEVEQLARMALSSPTVRAAFASPMLYRELYVSTRIGGVVLDGFVDLSFDDGAGLVVVDYKTDRVGDVAEIEAVAGGYELQAAAYALALEAAAGRQVSRCVLVFLRPEEPVEHEVADLPGRIAQVRELVSAAGGGADDGGGDDGGGGGVAAPADQGRPAARPAPAGPAAAAGAPKDS